MVKSREARTLSSFELPDDARSDNPAARGRFQLTSLFFTACCGFFAQAINLFIKIHHNAAKQMLTGKFGGVNLQGCGLPMDDQESNDADAPDCCLDL